MAANSAGGSSELLQHIFERLRSRLEHVLQRLPLDLDFLDFICTQEHVFLNALSSQLTVCPAILEELTHLQRLISSEKERTNSCIAVVQWDTFCSGWDNHPLRTESNMTPNQLWVVGRSRHPIPEPENMEGMEIPHIEWEESGLPHQDHSGVVVPNINCPLTDEQMAALRSAVDPRAESDSFGSDVYIAAVEFCEHFFPQ